MGRPHIDAAAQARAERLLSWVWTERGFRASVPRMPPLTWAVITAAMVSGGMTGLTLAMPEQIGIFTNVVVIAGVAGAMVTYARARQHRSLRLPGWPDQPGALDPSRYVDLAVEGRTLRIGDQRWPLAEVTIRLAGELLVLKTATEQRSFHVPPNVVGSVRTVLVPWLGHAIDRARATAPAQASDEQRARHATAALRRGSTRRQRSSPVDR